MIDPKSRSLKWILKSCENNKVSDPTLMEKTIRALSLLEALVKSGCPFLFKGGSALMLQLACTQRLSVDIDIVCPPGTDVISYLEPYAEEYGFRSIMASDRISRANVPKTHAKCFYQVSYVTNTATEKILLDVLFEDNWYSVIERLPIESPFLLMSGEPLMVSLPSKEDLLGDKLTAFAPNTTGIPYIKTVTGRGGLPEERHCSMEIIKQLFDVASLFDKINNLGTVRATFKKIARIELEYRNMASDTLTPILDDIYKTSELICTGIYTKNQSFEYQELVKGINQIRNLIVSKKYNHYSVLVNASKAAYLSVLLKKGIDVIEHFNPAIDLRPVKLGDPIHPAINRIKAIRPEAFFYWMQIEKILNG